MKHGSCSILASLQSRFPLQRGDSDTKREFQQESPNGSFCLSPSSAGRSCLRSPWWNTFASTRGGIYHRVCNMTSRILNGWNSYVHSPRRSTSTSPRSFFHVSLSCCKGSSGEGRQRCVTHLAGSFHGGSGAIRTCPRGHSRRATLCSGGMP